MSVRGDKGITHMSLACVGGTRCVHIVDGGRWLTECVRVAAATTRQCMCVLTSLCGCASWLTNSDWVCARGNNFVWVSEGQTVGMW